MCLLARDQYILLLELAVGHLSISKLMLGFPEPC